MNSRLEPVRPAVALDELTRFGELLDAQQVRALLALEFGAVSPNPQVLHAQRRLFYVVCAGVELYPAFQWHENRLNNGLSDVLSVLTPHRAAWKILSWFYTDNRHLDGATPADLLPRDPQSVLQAARLELEARSVYQPGAATDHRD